LFKKIKQLGFWIINAVLLLQVKTATVLAQDSNSGTTETKAPQIPKISTLPGPQEGDVGQVNKYLTSDLLPRIANTVVQIAITASVVFLIVGAIMFLTAYGNDEKLSNAKKTVIFALIGLFISLLSYAIVQLLFFTSYTIT
jgi:hypothetical protein